MTFVARRSSLSDLGSYVMAIALAASAEKCTLLMKAIGVDPDKTVQLKYLYEWYLLLTIIRITANTVDPDQTIPNGEA